MKKTMSWMFAALCAFFFAGQGYSSPTDDRGLFQVELTGGLSLLWPKDLNLLSRAEERYNQIYFVQRHLGWKGYFINDFPEIRYSLPIGIGVRCRVSGGLSLSASWEGFRRSEDYPVSGQFSYSEGWTLTERLEYGRFHLGLEGWTALGGVHYSMTIGKSLELEAGVAAGWAQAKFDFGLDRTYTVTLDDPGYPFQASDGRTLEGDGKGGGLAARVMLRLSRPLGRRFGVFAESSYTYCRLRAIEGGGRETRLGIPGETTWTGTWGIKREQIVMPYFTETVFVPTNYWGGWTAAQHQRDFVLDLSGLRLGVGLFVRL